MPHVASAKGGLHHACEAARQSNARPSPICLHASLWLQEAMFSNDAAMHCNYGSYGKRLFNPSTRFIPGGSAAAPALAPAPAVQPSASGTPALAPVSAVAMPLPFEVLSLPAVASSPSDNFPMDGLPLSFYLELIDANGGEAAFESLTTSNVKRSIIVPKTQNTKLSLCALKATGE